MSSLLKSFRTCLHTTLGNSNYIDSWCHKKLRKIFMQYPANLGLPCQLTFSSSIPVMFPHTFASHYTEITFHQGFPVISYHHYFSQFYFSSPACSFLYLCQYLITLIFCSSNTSSRCIPSLHTSSWYTTKGNKLIAIREQLSHQLDTTLPMIQMLYMVELIVLYTKPCFSPCSKITAATVDMAHNG